MPNPMGKYGEFLTDAAREQKYRDIENARVRECYPIGTRVAYSSVGEPGVKAGLGEYGVVASPMSDDFLIRVDWDKSAPSWIDAYRLTPVTIVPIIHHLKCTRCGHTWFPRSTAKPKNCAKCRSPYWDKPRQTKH